MSPRGGRLRACSSTGRASRSQREGSGFDPRQVHTGSAMLPQASECPVGFGRPATGRGGRLRVGSPLRRRQGSGPAGTEPRAGGMDAEPSAPPGTDCGAAWSAHLTGGQGVAGSNPANPTGRMASNSIRCIVDTFRRRDGGTLPTKAGRRVWNPGWYVSVAVGAVPPTATMVQLGRTPYCGTVVGSCGFKSLFVALKACHGLDGSDSG